MTKRCILLFVTLTWSFCVYSQERLNCNCGEETLHHIEVHPEQPIETSSFKKHLSKYIDTLILCGSDTGSVIVKFSVNRCGDIEGVSTISHTTELFKYIIKALVSSGKWKPGNNGGKPWCVYVALKFEMHDNSWHIKRLNPFSYKEEPKLFFQE